MKKKLLMLGLISSTLLAKETITVFQAGSLKIPFSQIEKAFEECGYNSKYGRVINSNRPDLCEIQCDGALMAAKEYKKAPIN